MMTCDRGFLHSFSVWTVPVCLLRIRGELAIGAHLSATDLYEVGSFDPDHDTVMRIGGEAPGGGPILSVGIKCQVRIRHPATSDRQFGSRAEKPARAEMVLSAVLVQVTPFRMLDVRRRPPVVACRGDDHCLARGHTAISGAGTIPQCERALILKHQKAPGELGPQPP